jgi:alpha-glucosidase
MNLGLSGVALVGADIGGFFGDCGPELLVRWMQLGACYPLTRNHCARGFARQEPWVHGPEVERACRSAIEWRYQLVPYLYTLCAEAARAGGPVLRPLFFSFPGDAEAVSISDEAMLGPALLVAPVMRPGKRTREVYLPRGLWYDVRLGDVIEGPCNVLADAPLDSLAPTFARGGSVIPRSPGRQWIDDRPDTELMLDVYPDATGKAIGTLYDDDGISFAYQRGASCWTTISCSSTASGWCVVSDRGGAYDTGDRTIELRIHEGRARVHSATLRDTVHWRCEIER